MLITPLQSRSDRPLAPEWPAGSAPIRDSGSWPAPTGDQVQHAGRLRGHNLWAEQIAVGVDEITDLHIALDRQLGWRAAHRFKRGHLAILHPVFAKLRHGYLQRRLVQFHGRTGAGTAPQQTEHSAQQQDLQTHSTLLVESDQRDHPSPAGCRPITVTIGTRLSSIKKPTPSGWLLAKRLNVSRACR